MCRIAPTSKLELFVLTRLSLAIVFSEYAYDIVGSIEVALLLTFFSAPAILLVHGDMDELIPLEAMFMAREQLAQAGLAVEWHVAQGVGHGIDAEGLHLGGAFLKQAFASTAAIQ